MTRGFYTIGVWQPKKEHNIGTLYRSAMSFGAAGTFEVGTKETWKQPGNTVKAWRHVPHQRFQDIDDLIAHLPVGCQLVGVELHPDAVPLPDFIHPERACYLLGREDNGLPRKVMEACHHLVEVPGASHCLNVAVAGSIVLYDRVAHE